MPRYGDPTICPDCGAPAREEPATDGYNTYHIVCSLDPSHTQNVVVIPIPAFKNVWPA